MRRTEPPSNFPGVSGFSRVLRGERGETRRRVRNSLARVGKKSKVREGNSRDIFRRSWLSETDFHKKDKGEKSYKKGGCGGKYEGRDCPGGRRIL